MSQLGSWRKSQPEAARLQLRQAGPEEVAILIGLLDDAKQQRQRWKTASAISTVAALAGWIVGEKVLRLDPYSYFMVVCLAILLPVAALLVIGTLEVTGWLGRPFRLAVLALGETEDLTILPPLTDPNTTQDGRARSLMRRVLVKLLPRALRESPNLLTEELCFNLAKPLPSLSSALWSSFAPDYCLVALDVIEGYGGPDCIQYVRGLAARKGGIELEQQITIRAAACLKALEQRENQQRPSRTLLRFSNAAPPTLVMPASESHGIESDQLLRAGPNRAASRSVLVPGDDERAI